MAGPSTALLLVAGAVIGAGRGGSVGVVIGAVIGGPITGVFGAVEGASWGENGAMASKGVFVRPLLLFAEVSLPGGGGGGGGGGGCGGGGGGTCNKGSAHGCNWGLMREVMLSQRKRAQWLSRAGLQASQSMRQEASMAQLLQKKLPGKLQGYKSKQSYLLLTLICHRSIFDA